MLFRSRTLELDEDDALELAEGEAAGDRYGHTGREIVGLYPKQTPVPIEPRRRFRLLHESPGPARGDGPTHPDRFDAESADAPPARRRPWLSRAACAPSLPPRSGPRASPEYGERARSAATRRAGR